MTNSIVHSTNTILPRCPYFLKCSGCSLWNTPYETQKQSKIKYLVELLNKQFINQIPTIGFLSCGEFALRHRADFTIQYDLELNQHQIGFYDVHKKILPIEHCLQFTPELQQVYSEFVQFRFYYGLIPLKKGSVRLRVGPNGLKGCWLDFSNIEIKSLLEDQVLFNKLLDAGFQVEIGQKGKKLIRLDNRLKLINPTPDIWFKTTDLQDRTLDLASLISNFTQPSWHTARTMVQLVLNWMRELKVHSVLEFGSGIGQFTIPFLSQNLFVTACELDPSAANYLNQNVKNLELQANLNIQIGDFHKKHLSLNQNYDIVFVNPARSGLRDFTKEILKTKAQYVIYVSCFPESMALDLAELASQYKLSQINIIDQFPQTQHFETCVLLTRLD